MFLIIGMAPIDFPYARWQTLQVSDLSWTPPVPQQSVDDAYQTFDVVTVDGDFTFAAHLCALLELREFHLICFECWVWECVSSTYIDFRFIRTEIHIVLVMYTRIMRFSDCTSFPCEIVDEPQYNARWPIAAQIAHRIQ